MTFSAGIDPKTGVRAKRVEVYEFLRARPCQAFTVPELEAALGVSKSTLWGALSGMTQVREVAGSYPHVHKLEGSRFTFDPSIQRGVLPTRAQVEAKREKKAAKKRQRSMDAHPTAQVRRGPVSDSVFGLKPVADVRVMQDAAGKRYVVSQGKGRTEIVEI